MPIQAKNATEPIPGYRIRKRIGAGGFGEVWASDAPGGLTKAIKFVYGYLDDERANRELKSLNRVRGVRHPFLLSLERIEVVDGQLLIVTELADTSLKSRFEDCRQAGRQGIPRDELLGYLKDTADALDYMSERHTLQHLDVKPENLLLLSGRIKVADFGLVKDIGERSVSMMGGLTPLYAAPEVYDGMPTKFSDQYSLAIVYQEMLTGHLPFDGKTAAQLAVQHASVEPDLESLPPRDQSILRKALAKQPTDRFASCGEMIEYLIKGESLEESTTSTPSIVIGRREQPLPPDAALPQRMAEQLVSGDGVLDIKAQCRPTLFVGVGGLGGKIISCLKGQMTQRFQGEAPPFQVLAVDTDSHAIQRLKSNIEGTLLSSNEVVSAPLRRPEDYRLLSGSLLKWMSRRWLYNIPRSQQCEGRRPLGRLAFVDHAAKILEAIHEAVSQAMDPEGVSATARKGDIEFEDGVSIVLVGSVSGATGSGMMLDLAFASRQILAGMGVANADVRGLLIHAVGGDQTIRQLASVNAYAFAEEWEHYARRGYPGDISCGLKPARPSQPPFDDAYLVPIGERLSEHELSESLQRLADFLYLDTVTVGGAFFRRCRDEERIPAAKAESVLVRTFGLDRIGMEDDEWVEASVEVLANDLARYWQGHSPQRLNNSSVILRDLSGDPGEESNGFSKERKARLDELARQRANKLALNEVTIKSAIDRLVEAELGAGTVDFLKRMVREVSKHRGALEWAPDEFFAAVQTTFGEAVMLGGPQQEQPRLETQLTSRLRSLADACGQKLGVWLRHVVEHEDVRIGGARYLARAMQSQLEQMEQRCAERIKECQQEAANHEELLTRMEPAGDKGPLVPRVPTSEELLHYAQIRLNALAFRCVARFAHFVAPSIEEADTDLRELDKSWELARQKLALSKERVRAGNDASRAALNYLTGGGLGRLVEESRLQITEMSGRNILFDAMETLAHDTGVATASLRRAARRALVNELRQSEVACFPESSTPPRAVRLTLGLAAAAPALRGCGGAQRLLVMIPKSSSEYTAKRFFAEEADQSPTILQSHGDDVIICYEVGKVPLPRVATVLAQGRRDFIQCASRVRTRTDVEWQRLSD